MNEPAADLRPLRICHVLLTDRFAGSERYAIDLANLQAERHRVSMVLPASAAEDRPDALRQRISPRVQLHLLGGWKLLRPWAARFLVARRLRPDVAHAHLSQACKALGGMAPPLRGPAPLRVATLHIHYKPQQHRRLDGLIAIAPWQEVAIPATLPHAQIDNWLSPDAGQATPEARAELRRSLGLAPDTVLVGALGRTEHSKGLDLLLQAWQRLAPDPQRARLAIVGHGRDWDRLRAQAPAGVLMPGFSDQPAHWMAAFDLFVSAARSEPFGLVFLEAMRAGLPVLASASEGARHLAGLIDRPLVPVDDADALAQALAPLLQQAPARRSYALQAFDAATQAARIEAFYRQLLAQRGAQEPPP